jgi:hypothetical protein
MNSEYSRRGFIETGIGALAAPAIPKHDNQKQNRVSRADLIYTQPVARSEEGMPLGNGRMGTLVWTTPSQIRFQINRADVYANSSYSNSFFERHNDYCGGCAYVEIEFSEPVFAGSDFHQRLAVYDGAMTVEGSGMKAELVAWPDQDVMAIQVTARKNTLVRAKLRMLRHASQYFGKQLETFATGHIAAVQTRSHMALSQLEARGDRILLTQEFREGEHYNKSAVAMGIPGAKAEIADETEIRLTAVSPGRPFTILLASAASFDKQIDVADLALRQLDAAASKGYRAVATDTNTWWHNFWSRGAVELHSDDGAADFVEQNYTYFLYVMASSSRGKFPPKFNGMLWNTGGDLRSWGAQHWFANTSCYYEALFSTGRLELLDPAFDMYSGMHDACAVAARQQWGSQGIYIPETAYFDGLEKLPDDIAAEMRELYLMRKPWAERSEQFRKFSETKHPHSSRWNWMASGEYVKGRWTIEERGSGPYGNVSHIFGSTAKIAYLYWRRYEFTQDRDWLRTRAYPMLRGALEFYRNHPNVGKGEDGKYHIRYANSNESVWGARDTDEDLSSMRGVGAALLRASEILDLDSGLRPQWQEFVNNLAALPLSTDADALKPAEYHGPQVFARGRTPAVKAGRGLLPDANSLPMWFFDLCNLESLDADRLRIANATFDSYFRGGITAETPVSVLSKLAIAAATLGRADAVRHLIPNQIRALSPERNTAYKNGGVLANRMTLREGPQALDAQRLGRAAEALHLALLQSAPPAPGEESVIRLFAACPKEWNARFTLLSRGGFLVTAAIEKGQIHSVELVSQTGSPCRMRNPWAGATVEVLRAGGRTERLTGPLLAFQTGKEEKIVLRRL